MASRIGVGKWHFGKANLSFDPSTGIEQFSTTMFILVLWFPLVPTSSFVIRKKRGSYRARRSIVRRLPLDWGQVFRVWAVATCLLSILIWVLKRI